MNKLLAALIAGLFAVSVNAFAADAAPKADAAAAPAAKHTGKHASKKAAPKAEAANRLKLLRLPSNTACQASGKAGHLPRFLLSADSVIHG
jgi:hypothetical protein